MEISAAGLFRAKWTIKIQDEWISNLLKNRADLTQEQLERTRGLMNEALPDANVENYESLESGLGLPDHGDNHVLAAAIHCKADGIVTFNLKDFPTEMLEPFEMDAQHPDEFLYHQIGLDQAGVLNAVRRCRGRLKSPPVSADRYLQTLYEQGLPTTVDWLAEYAPII